MRQEGRHVETACLVHLREELDGLVVLAVDL
jgi:hypothetical protein